jgi:hypothetical protein
MSGCFGLLKGRRNSYHMPPDVLRPDCGKFVTRRRAGNAANRARGNLIAAGEARKIEIDVNPVRVSWHKGLPRPVFICPACQRVCYRTRQ